MSKVQYGYDKTVAAKTKTVTLKQITLQKKKKFF